MGLVDGGVVLVKRGPGLGRLIAGIISTIVVLVMIYAAIYILRDQFYQLAPLLLLALMASTTPLTAYSARRRIVRAAARARQAVLYWDPEQGRVTLSESVIYEKGWLVARAFISRRVMYGEVRFFHDGDNTHEGNTISLENRYMYVGSPIGTFFLAIPAARILSECCRHAIIAGIPTHTKATTGATDAEYCEDKLSCLKASVRFEPRRVEAEASNPTSNRYLLKVCPSNDRILLIRYCATLMELGPGAALSRVFEERYNPVLIVTHVGSNAFTIKTAVIGDNGPPIAGDILGFAKEVSARFERVKKKHRLI